MSKSNKTRNNYNDLVVEALKNKYGVTRSYILKSIKGERVGTLPIQIKEEYTKADEAAIKVVKESFNDI